MTRVSTLVIFGLLLLAPLYAGPYAYGGEPRNELERYNHRGIWDGRWTNAKSGLGTEIPDAGSSEGKAGTDEDPRSYFIPTHQQLNLMYDTVERDDIANVGKVSDYASEALIQFTHRMNLNGYPIEKGYYQVYLGDGYSGSRKVNLGGYNQPLPPEIAKKRQKGKIENYSAVILKKQGQVIAALPIHRRERYDRQEGERKSKRAFALVANEPSGPVLKVYYKRWIYITDISRSQLPVVYPEVTNDLGMPAAMRKAPSMDESVNLPSLQP